MYFKSMCTDHAKSCFLFLSPYIWHVYTILFSYLFRLGLGSLQLFACFVVSARKTLQL